jgi:Cellulase N-terminal ig-like domain
MPSPRFSRSLVFFAVTFLPVICAMPCLAANSAAAYVRVSQVGYETADAPYQAYLMSTAVGTGATFKVIHSEGATAYSGAIGALIGTWGGSSQSYDV